MWNDECRGPSPGFLLIIFFYKLVSEDGYLHQLALEEMNPKKDDKEKDKEKLVHFCICKIIINCRSYWKCLYCGFEPGGWHHLLLFPAGFQVTTKKSSL